MKKHAAAVVSMTGETGLESRRQTHGSHRKTNLTKICTMTCLKHFI